jgi:hypothetical protein
LVALLLIEYFLGLFLRRSLPGGQGGGGGGHYSFRLDLKRSEINQSDLEITSTDLLIKALSQTLQESPRLQGYLLHGVFFPAQIRNSFRISLKLFSQHSVPINNAHLMSFDEIHLLASEALTNEEKKQSPSRPCLSFVFHLIQTHVVNYFQQFSFGFATVAPYPHHLTSQFKDLNFMNTPEMSHSPVPIFVTVPHVDLLRASNLKGKGGEEGDMLPISVTIHNAVFVADALAFANLLKRNLLLFARPSQSSSPSCE